MHAVHVHACSSVLADQGWCCVLQGYVHEYMHAHIYFHLFWRQAEEKNNFMFALQYMASFAQEAPATKDCEVRRCSSDMLTCFCHSCIVLGCS
jgi:hypothetical protein